MTLAPPASMAAARRLSRRAFTVIVLLIAAGTIARIVVAFATVGHPYDMASASQVASLLADDPLHVYSAANPAGHYRFPYPPGLFGWLLASLGLSRWTGLPLHGVFPVAAIAADAAIAWLVQDLLARRGASDRVRVGAVALVAAGPVFAVTSGYHGQFDSLAILPAVAALAVWERMDGPRRALVAGALIGIGGSLKLVPLLLVLVLLPRSRSAREAITLGVSAAAVPAVLLAPFLLADGAGVVRMLRYGGGLPGAGGLSLALQPDFARFWVLRNPQVIPNAVTRAFLDHRLLFNAPVPLLAAAFVFRRRIDVRDAATVLWLAILVFSMSFFVQYVVWALPFVLAAGYLRQTAFLQAALVAPMVLFYTAPHDDGRVAVAYAAIMIAVWVALVVSLLLLGRRIVRR